MADLKTAKNHNPHTALPWGLLAIIAFCYVYPFPYFDKLRSAQEMPRILLTQQIVEEHTFALNSRLKELGSWNDLSIGPDGRYYANKSPGPSIVAIPAYIVARLLHVTSIRGLTWALRFGATTLPAILFLPLFYRLTGEFSQSARARRAALIALALGSPAFVYSLLLMGHQLAAICLASSFYLLIQTTKHQSGHSHRSLIFAGLLAGFAPLMDYQATLVVPALGVYLLLRSRNKLTEGALFAASVLPGPLLLGFYHFKCFGSPFRISYGYGLDTAPKEGVLGFIGPNSASLGNILTTPSNGLFTLSPWLAVAAIGAYAILRHPTYKAIKPQAWLCFTVIVIYTLFVGSMLPYMARGGWSAGARQLVATLPFYGAFAAVGFERLEQHPRWRGLVCGLVLSSVFVFSIAATTYPHWPDALANPLFELSLRLLREGYAIHSVGTLVGLHGLYSLAPLYLLIVFASSWGLFAKCESKRSTIAAATVTALMVVALYSVAPRSGPYAERAWNFVVSTWEPTR